MLEVGRGRNIGEGGGRGDKREERGSSHVPDIRYQYFNIAQRIP